MPRLGLICVAALWAGASMAAERAPPEPRAAVGAVARQYTDDDSPGPEAAQADHRLGVDYMDGADGTPKDDAQAFAWLSKAAALNDGDSEMRLGQLYLDGRGVAK